MMFGMTLAALSLGLLALSLPAHAQQPAPANGAVVAIVDGTQVHRSGVEAMDRILLWLCRKCTCALALRLQSGAPMRPIGAI
jgi:hypothetical protein